MPKNALVILGAGASKGLYVTGQNISSPTYKPPITKEIFTSCEATNLHLFYYEKAEPLANVLRVSLESDENSLEAEMLRLRESGENAEALLELPIFFQELFGEISAKYSTSNGYYDFLVNRLLRSDINKTAFVTLNYDLFLDRALLVATGTRDGTFRDIRSYTAKEGWMLIKLHGSVSWMRPILSPGNGPGSTRDAKRSLLLSLLDKNPVLSASGAGELRVVAWDDWFMETPSGAQPHYPQLAVPVKDKPEPVCPQQHLEALRDFLPTCKNVLTIGVSGSDDDLFEQMAGLPDCANFYVVGKTEEEATEAANDVEPESEAEKIADRFKNGVPRLRNGWSKENAFDGGFAGFLTAGGLDKFIAEARD